jgi:hypothetical protein
VTSLDKPNEASAFIAVLLAFIGFADLTAASLNEDTALEYWLSNVPVRLLFLFGLSGYIYLFKEDGVFGSRSVHQDSAGERVRNSLIFAWAFVETVTWFWVGTTPLHWKPLLTATQVFTSLREERRQAARRRIERLQAEEDRL